MPDRQNQRMKIFTPGRTDVTLFFVVIFLMVFGIIMIYSSSYHESLTLYGTNAFYFIRQSLWVSMGTVVMYGVSRINHKIFLRLSGLLYIGVVGALAAVLMFGEVINGSRRWLYVAGMKFQPSEMAKLGLILVLATLLVGFKDHLDKLKVIVPVVVVGALPIVLVGPANMSTALIMMGIMGAMLLVIYPNLLKLALITLPPISLGIWLMLTKFSYRMDRLSAWLQDPFLDPTDSGYQTIQSLYAIGSGGLFGKGLGKSIQKIDFIPEAHNDIIFSIICEELGLFGAFSILLLFAILLWRLFDLIRQTADEESVLVVVGVMAHIGLQVFVNIGVVTNAIPATGIPLPFVSYGGSSLLFLLVEMGIVLNIARQTNERLEKKDVNNHE